MRLPVGVVYALAAAALFGGSTPFAKLLVGRVQVVPFSSKTGKLYPCDATVTLNGTESKAMADQITTVSKERLLKFLGVLSPHDMHRVDMAMRIQLGLAA